MTSVFEQRLIQALQLNEVSGATRRKSEKRGVLAQSLGFTDPSSDKDMDALALTRFPAGVPQDIAKQLEDQFGIPAEEAPYAIRVAPGDKTKQLSKLDGVEDIGPPWTKAEIVNALWPMIANHARTYSSGGWNKTNADFDRTAFEELAQNAVVGIMKAIDSEEDRGDPFLPWIKMRVKGLVSSGMTVDSDTNAAAGFYERLAKASKPEQVDKLIAEIPERDRDTDKPSKPREGNRYGQHAPELYSMAMKTREILVRYQSKVQDEKDEATEDLVSFRKLIEKEREGLKSHGRLLGARTGLYDTISTPHSDTRESRFLQKVVQTTDLDKLQMLGKPPDEETGELYRAYEEALKAGDKSAIDDAQAAINKYLSSKGDRNAFRASHKRTSTHVTGASGDEIENPKLPGTKENTGAKNAEDKDNVMHSKDVVSQLLRAGLKGVQVGLDKQGRPRVVKLEPRDFRIIIRMFGISDYPYKGTGKDPELNEGEFNKLSDALLATVGEKDPEKAVPIKPVSAAEARWMIEMSAKQISDNYDEYEENYRDLLGFYKDSKEVLLLAPDEDTALAIAQQAASSTWVRKGCPQMTTGEIWKDLWDGKGDNSTAGLAMNKAIGRPSTEIDGLTGKKKAQKFVGIGGANPESKLYMIAQAMAGELGIDPDDPEWDHGRVSKESLRRVLNIVTEAALWRLYQISDHFLGQAVLTEALDSIDFRLLSDTRNAIGSYLVNFCVTLRQ